MFGRNKYKPIEKILKDNPGFLWVSPLGDRIYALIGGKLHYMNGEFLNASADEILNHANSTIKNQF